MKKLIKLSIAALSLACVSAFSASTSQAPDPFAYSRSLLNGSTPPSAAAMHRAFGTDSRQYCDIGVKIIQQIGVDHAMGTHVGEVKKMIIESSDQTHSPSGTTLLLIRAADLIYQGPLSTRDTAIQYFYICSHLFDAAAEFMSPE